jgi:hypothetical protein
MSTTHKKAVFVPISNTKVERGFCSTDNRPALSNHGWRGGFFARREVAAGITQRRQDFSLPQGGKAMPEKRQIRTSARGYETGSPNLFETVDDTAAFTDHFELIGVRGE